MFRKEITFPWPWLNMSSRFISSDSINIAYLIMVHSLETVRGVDRILHRLYDTKHTFVIHIDRFVDYWWLVVGGWWLVVTNQKYQ
jgi:hypothetical protein